MRELGVHAFDLWEAVLGRSVDVTLLEDNQTTAINIRPGRFPKLRHVQRMHGANIRWLYDGIQRGIFSVQDCHIQRMAADVFTKQFTSKNTWGHAIRLLGFRGAGIPCIIHSKPRAPAACTQPVQSALILHTPQSVSNVSSNNVSHGLSIGCCSAVLPVFCKRVPSEFPSAPHRSVDFMASSPNMPKSKAQSKPVPACKFVPQRGRVRYLHRRDRNSAPAGSAKVRGPGGLLLWKTVKDEMLRDIPKRVQRFRLALAMDNQTRLYVVMTSIEARFLR